ncbi:MAG: PP2C family protein-serine/threonine phosphatase [Spirochaetales bacterium]|nr:PP2C family protein-serine/threonine phosphatase [Spirochaetales bacterium]
MRRRRKKHPLTLSVKLNMITILIILLLMVGLVTITYRSQDKELHSKYYLAASNAAETTAENISADAIKRLLKVVRTEEFENVRTKAVMEKDPQIIADWLSTQNGGILSDESFEEFKSDPSITVDQLYLLSAMYYYNLLLTDLDIPLRNYEIKYAYLQYMEDGVTFNLVDKDLGLLGVGSVENPVKEFAGYKDFEQVPPTVYKSEYGWLCTALVPVYDEYGLPVAMVGVDIDMNQVHSESLRFLLNIIVFVFLLTALCIFLSIRLVNYVAVRPLELLTKATTSFGKGTDQLSMDDVIEVDIKSQDEIRDLYNEIRAMQRRIVNYTDDLQKYTAEKARISTELGLATQIQDAMLKTDFPAFPDRSDFSIFASMDPAKEVGGDFYDFFLIDDNHLAMLIADVSGKGIPAALFMMSSMILLKTRLMTDKSPADVMRSVNEELCSNNVTKMFVTVWIGILDLRSGKMVCSNAGHEYPAKRTSDGQFQIVKDRHCPVLGAMEDIEYSDYTLTLGKGDTIFVYTDGVPEADNPQGEFYGTDRMIDILNTNAQDASPEDIIHSVRKDVDRFASGSEQFDDITMLCLKYNGPEEKK